MRVLSQEQEPVNSYFPWALGLAIHASDVKHIRFQENANRKLVDYKIN